MGGSIRQRSPGSWELRVFQGTDPVTGQKRWASRTIRGSRREAQAELAVLAEQVTYPRRHAAEATVADLLDRWVEAASPNWAPTTLRETRSIVGCHLKPVLGHLAVAKLTTADIDDFYGALRRRGGRDGQPLSAGTVHRVHGHRV